MPVTLQALVSFILNFYIIQHTNSQEQMQSKFTPISNIYKIQQEWNLGWEGGGNLKTKQHGPISHKNKHKA